MFTRNLESGPESETVSGLSTVIRNQGTSSAESEQPKIAPAARVGYVDQPILVPALSPKSAPRGVSHTPGAMVYWRAGERCGRRDMRQLVAVEGTAGPDLLSDS
jgi:hypothetical protein